MIHRKRFPQIKVVTLLFFACTAIMARTTGERLNILYITIEDTGPFTGYHNNLPVKTPHLDSLSEQSLTFMDAHCNVALCTPSRTSILTGIRPSTSGIVRINDNWQNMLPHAVSLPRHLRENGYYTHAVGKIYDKRCGGMDDAFVVDDSQRILDNQLPYQALEQIAARKDQPFFLAIGYAQAHTEWTPSDWAMEQYAAVPVDPAEHAHDYKGKHMNDEELVRFIRSYYAFITDVDRLVGNLVLKAEELGLLENTILIVGCLDHGYSLGWQGKYGKGNNRDMETRVPLMIKLPDKNLPPARIEALVELVDLYPTLVELCDLPAPPQELEGDSLVPLFHDPGRQWKQAVFTLRAYHLMDVGVKTREYNLILRAGEAPMLFDRTIDPFNLKDIASRNPDTVGEMMEIAQKGWRFARP